MTFSIEGVRLDAAASAQLQQLDRAQQEQVRHRLAEMAAVVGLTTSESGSLADARLHFSAAGVQVEYSIDDAAGLLTVHRIAGLPYARAG